MITETRFAQKACPEYEALLEDYLNGVLCGANVTVAAQHLEVCPQCSRAADAALAATRWLRETGDAMGGSPQPSPGFPLIVMARIRAVEAAKAAEGEGFWSTLVSLGRAFAVTATLAVALLAAYEARWAGTPQPNVATARPTDVRDLFSPELVRLPTNEGEALVMVTETDHANN